MCLKALNVVEKSNSFEMKFASVMDEKLLSFTQVAYFSHFYFDQFRVVINS